MSIWSKTDHSDEPGPGHSDEVLDVHERILGASPARSRYIEVSSGRRVHVIEAGEGSPVIFLHGTGEASISLLAQDVGDAGRGPSLIDRLEGVRAIAVDRPGFGLSQPLHVPRERFRDTAIEFIDEVLDELRLETSALAGSSLGGTWALWYAIARPERVRRLVLIGSAPLLPDTRVPPPVRVMTAPVVGDVLARVVKPNAKMVLRLMSSMGEKDTIVRYPDLIESLVAAGSDPVASAANLAEFRAISSPFGFRRALRVHPSELRGLTVPTLIMWGDHDPVGSVEVAQVSAKLIPNAQLEVLSAGHVPWFGSPARVSELLSKFVRSGSDG